MDKVPDPECHIDRGDVSVVEVFRLRCGISNASRMPKAGSRLLTVVTLSTLMIQHPPVAQKLERWS